MSEDYQSRLSQLAMIIHVSRIDHEVSEEEQAFVDAIAERLRITDEDKLKLMMGEITVQLHVPESEWDRVEQFHLCMMTSSSSGVLDDEEIQFCQRLGLKFGLRGLAMDNAIQLFKKYHPAPVPWEEMKRVYQLGHN